MQALDDEEYGGPHPFSEPESRIVKLIAESSPVRSFVNLHSGEYALYIPWDSHPNYAIDLPVWLATSPSGLPHASCWAVQQTACSIALVSAAALAVLHTFMHVLADAAKT